MNNKIWHFSAFFLFPFYNLWKYKKMPKESAPENKKKLSSQNEKYIFSHETLIFHYAHKRSIFQKYFRISKNGHL